MHGLVDLLQPEFLPAWMQPAWLHDYWLDTRVRYPGPPVEFLIACFLAWRIPARRMRTFLLLASIFTLYLYFGVLFAVGVVAAAAASWLLAEGLARWSLRRGSARVPILTGAVLVHAATLWLYWRSLPGLHYLLRDESMGRGELWLFCGVGFGVLRVILYIRHACREPTVRRSLADCLLYISFFPVFRLGPVIGPDSLSTAIDAIPHRRSPALVRSGLRWFGVGMLKQIIGGCVIELYFQTFFPPGSRPLLRELFDPSTHAAVWQYWVGAFLFHLRIYCMFSGYSDLARGMCNIIGLTTPDNFVLPFLSPSLTTMWQRWHRTFGLWLRDLIYIPLGGNQRQGGRNLFVTFLYAGLWHFPYLNGLTFAAINVSVLMFERVFGRWWQRQRARRTLPYRLLRYLRIADGPVGVALRVGAANMVMAAAGACVLDYHYGGIHLLAGMLGLRSGG